MRSRWAIARSSSCRSTRPRPERRDPYSALSVFAIDPVYISLTELEGIEAPAIDAAHAGSRARGSIARTRVQAIKLKLLDRGFRWFQFNGGAGQRAAFEAFIDHNRGWLRDYALFRALKERFGFSPWENWSEGLKRRDPGALEEASRELAEPIGKFCYFQYIAHRQWSAMREEAARRGAMLGGDLAFSPGRDSAEVWAHQELFNLERTVGTPPDAFSSSGQRWGLPMPNWERMRAEGLGWWRMRARHAAELYDLFRVDHVVGLYRTFSFGADPGAPGEFFPAEEGAQRAQGEEVVRAIKEEAGASAVIAEDLGSVPPWVKMSLSSLGVPGYKVFRWEKENWDTPQERFVMPSAYPELSVATTGTHDTETLAAWWRGSPERERREIFEALGVPDLDLHRERLSPQILDAILRALYASPSCLALAPIRISSDGPRGSICPARSEGGTGSTGSPSA